MADQHLILERRRKQNKSSNQQGVGKAQVISPVKHLFHSIINPFFAWSLLLHCKYCHTSTNKVRVLSLQYFQIQMLKLFNFLCCFVDDVVLEAKSCFVPPSSFRTVHAISMHGGVNPGYFIHHQGFTGALYFIKCKFILYTALGFRRKLYTF